MVTRLEATSYEKIWGSPDTQPWYANPEGRNIGEVWFATSDKVPLLVKLLFTSDNLSVQVHPGDEYARVHRDSCGKTEMWHILRAEPGAEIALGLRERVSPNQLREAAISGAIMDMLNWIPASKGDTFFVPAGTIHAIGGGLVLCEVQQHSDVTYRLYDYGRRRELHLDDSLAVANLEAQGCRSVALPVECAYFRTDTVSVQGSVAVEPLERNRLYIVLEGEGAIGGLTFRSGEAFDVAAGTGFEISGPEATLLFTEGRAK